MKKIIYLFLISALTLTSSGAFAVVGTVGPTEKDAGLEKDGVKNIPTNNIESRQVPDSFRHKAPNFNDLLLIFDQNTENPDKVVPVDPKLEKEATPIFLETKKVPSANITKNPPKEKIEIKQDEEKRSVIQNTNKTEQKIEVNDIQARKVEKNENKNTQKKNSLLKFLLGLFS